MTFTELKDKLADEGAESFDATEVREAIMEADEIIKSLDTRIADLQVDFNETKEALYKARILNAKYYNNAIDVVKETTEEVADNKYFATEEEIKEAFD